MKITWFGLGIFMFVCGCFSMIGAAISLGQNLHIWICLGLYLLAIAIIISGLALAIKKLQF
ncbi:MAG TPA: hypothetical protein VJJ80_01705 [Patescibacteria group bacterium]|nr:hypothetical protein [Patescibacteria group bacterium]